MKQLFFSLTLLIFSATAFGQQTSSSVFMSIQDYLQKSKRQKTAAWVLVGGGGALVLTGIIIPKGEIVHEGFWLSYKNDGIKNSLALGGFVSMLSSIPFFIASHRNKTKAKAVSVSFRMENVRVIQHSGFVSQSIPSLNLKLSL